MADRTLRRQQVRLVVAHAADSLTFAAFYIWFAGGAYVERNPVMLAAMAVGGIVGAVAFKMGIIGWIVWRSNRPIGQSKIAPLRVLHEHLPDVGFHRRMRVIGLSFGAAIGIVGAAFNTVAIIHSIR